MRTLLFFAATTRSIDGHALSQPTDMNIIFKTGPEENHAKVLDVFRRIQITRFATNAFKVHWKRCLATQ